MRLRWKACFVTMCYSAIILPDIFLFFRCVLVVELSLTCCCLGNLLYFFQLDGCLLQDSTVCITGLKGSSLNTHQWAKAKYTKQKHLFLFYFSFLSDYDTVDTVGIHCFIRFFGFRGKSTEEQPFTFTFTNTTVQKFKFGQMFFKEVSLAHQGWIYWIKNTVKMAISSI